MTVQTSANLLRAMTEAGVEYVLLRPFDEHSLDVATGVQTGPVSSGFAPPKIA